MAEWDTGRGYSGAAFDRQVGHKSEQGPLEKVKEGFYTAKQVVIKKLGKKEDQHLIASDAELDAKLELYSSIKVSSVALMRIANRYQKVMHEISKEEYALGQFLKRHGEQDPSRAGIMLQDVAKAFVMSAQKRMEARAPLIRLAQDTLTYRRCAVTDTERKIEQMEDTRTEYRGALLWMKNVSEELDPDTYKRLERFRKVQAQVRAKKERFDSQKLDTLQKIDLLAISRLNMLSQSLSPYGTTLHDFYTRVTKVFESVEVPPIQNPAQETEERILKACKEAKKDRQPIKHQKPTTSSDVSLLDLSSEGDRDAPAGVPVGKSSSELLHELWRESGLENNNFNPLDGLGLEGLSLEPGDMTDKKDSPDVLPTGSLFNFSELDDTEKGSMDLFGGEVLQPTKFESAEKSASKESASSGLRAFLPSQLLKKGGWNASLAAPSTPSTKSESTVKNFKEHQKQKDAQSNAANPHQAWYNLFSDLDPLSNASQEVAKKSIVKGQDGFSC
ncbi:hypothetical protein RvY_07979 [Ramazzottius varieornatus]|uniref:AH domain-containing protein n=1 Tax=Ramazzottius varieornatus TaxID=947166 RepID=A0A1D1V473_RAMVA|nr:hypothetical protein RvY_07979 [Ramazzottius varieornatus]